jgi:CHAT domain-containing protein
LGGLAKIAFDLGRYDHALSYYSAKIDLARANDDAAATVAGTYGALTSRRKQMEDFPDPSRLAELTADARHLLLLADAAARPALQAMANRTLADLLAADAATRAAAEPHYRLALRQARRGGDRGEVARCLWALGRHLSADRPDQSRRLVHEAANVAAATGGGTDLVYARRQQMRLAWQTLPRDEAIAASLEALTAIESLRSRQEPDISRATVLGAWALDYHWLIGKVLDRAQPARTDLVLAFDIGERMRARLLLESLRSREARSRAADDRFASLDDVERSLRDDEALLTFDVGLWRSFYGEFAGGAWLLVSTNEGTRAIRMPDRAALQPQLFIFRGLVEQAVQLDPRPAIRLHELLLAEAIALMPKRVTRLVVVPDRPLHHLPFATLTPHVDRPPLGLTHHLTVTPSATVWLRTRAAGPPAAPGAALVFADPASPRENFARIAEERGWWGEASQLGRLPHARREGRAVVGHMGGLSRLLAGPRASEADLKTGDLSAFGILHFAAHSLVDEATPDHSAVVLAAGTEEDGLLQPREIAHLPLAGKLVVLSSCRSATGAVLAGEGVVGLSHAFLQAGARTVVGTLWPIRDDHAAVFFDAVYTHLRRGLDVASAVTEARKHAMVHGLPASAWAGVVVIGDGTLTVRPAARAVPGRPVIAAAVALVTISAAAWVRRRRRPLSQFW